jgi:hypothetical protein
VALFIGLAWTFGLLAWLPAVVIFRQRELDLYECLFLPNRVYVLCQSCIIYLVHILAMLYTYAQCVRALGVHFGKVGGIQQNPPLAMSARNAAPSFTITDTSAAPPVEEVAKQESDGVRHLRKANREHSRSVRTLGVVIGVFLFCWAPFCVLWPIQSLCGNCLPIGLYKYSYWAAYLNSTINPLL